MHEIIPSAQSFYLAQWARTINRIVNRKRFFGTRKLSSKKTHAGSIANTTLPACYTYDKHLVWWPYLLFLV